jgi:RNA polymerase sigma factor (sigma-70 family)
MKKSENSKSSKFYGFSTVAKRETRYELVILFVLAGFGSKEALEAFLRGCATIMLRWVGRNEEASANAFAYLGMHWQEWDGSKSELSTFLRWCCMAGFRALKRANQDKEVVFSMLDDNDEQYQDKIICLDDMVKTAEELQAVIDYLPQEDMEILCQYFYEGKTFAEIAAEQGVSKVTVRNNVLRIVNSCRQHFGTKGMVKGLTRHGIKYH